jgi:hypothetical protein
MKNLIPEMKTTALIEEFNGIQKDIVLEIDFDEGEISVYTEIRSNSTPGRIWNGLAIQRLLPRDVDAEDLHKFVEDEIQPIVQKMKDEFSVVYDSGNNRKGDYGQSEENGYFYELEKAIEGAPTHDGGLYDVRDWVMISKKELEEKTNAQLIEDINNDAYCRNVVLYGPELEDYINDLREGA